MIALPAVALAVLAGRLIYLQVRLRPQLLDYVQQQREATRTLPASRGSILDRNGRILAASYEVRGVYADPSIIRNPRKTAAHLARILNLDPGQVLDRIIHDPTRRFVWIQRQVERIESNEIRQLGLTGVGIQLQPKRVYPGGKSLCHVLGFVGRDHRGLEGLELAFDRQLAGRDGKQTVLVDARRREVGSPSGAHILPKDGNNLVLTIDAAIQQVVEQQLAQTVQKFEAQSAVGIVTNPKTGEVLAMACWPPFDPNQPNDFPIANRRNRTLTDPAEPGSVFKVFPASAYLNEGLTHPDEVIFCHNGEARLRGRLLHDAHKFGKITMSEIVARSSNIGMVILMERMSRPTLFDYLNRFGFGHKTRINLPGESKGLVPPLSKWSSYSAGSISFGQELAVTPLQLITAMGAIVNRGRMMRPRIVRSLLDPRGRVADDFPPEFVRQVVRSAVAETMTKEILVRTVNEGSGEKANLTDYQVLGKTGTAQIPFSDRPGYEPNAYLSSFLAAAPASDPQLCVLVQIRRPNPRISYYARLVAAPAAGEILRWTLTYLDVTPDKVNGTFIARSN